MTDLDERPSRKAISYAAGIALGRWYFGFPADAIEVVPQPGPGREAPAGPTRGEGEVRVVGPPIAPREAPDESGLGSAALEWQRRCDAVLADTELTVLACGLRAPSMGRGQCGVAAWRRKRPADYERARSLADRVAAYPIDGLEPELYLEMACVRARALLSGHGGQIAMYFLRRHLRRHGRLDGEQIYENCVGAMGGYGPARAAWSQSWPPSLEALRDFHMPYQEIDEEDLIERTYRAHDSLVASMR